MLYSINEWNSAPELPAAYSQTDNLITDFSYSRWRDSIINNYDRVDPTIKSRLEKLSPDLEKALHERYSQLRYLSKQLFISSLTAITNDIETSFDPAKTLFISGNGSGSAILSLLTKKRERLAQFGKVKWYFGAQEYVVYKRGSYQGESAKDAENLIHLDDWVLSSEQVQEVIERCYDPHRQFFSYHPVMSDKGHAIYSRNNLRGKYSYKLIGDGTPQDWYGSYSVYGWHMIPDRISKEFVATYLSSFHSIFSDTSEGKPVGKHSRLAGAQYEGLLGLDLPSS